MAKRIKTYKCPYCDKRMDRESLILHINHKHEEMIPEGYTARRVVFNMINNKTEGHCIICHKPTKWNEQAGHYDRYCGDPKCIAAARKQYLDNIHKVDIDYEFARDPEHQKKMLAGRKISGEYKFKDGGVRTYTGSYEKNLLEMADKILNIPSQYIYTPGPTLQYTYNGETHNWITDQYWEPWNLIIEVKDGGTKPNTREMPEYRTKQLCKEVMITDKGEYNYLRLTNNQFPQLIEILMEIKKENMFGNWDKPIVKIYETALQEMNHYIRKPEKDPRDQHGVYFISYSFKGYVDDENIEGFAIADSLIPNKIITVKEGKLVVEDVDFLTGRDTIFFHYLGGKTIEDIWTGKDVSENYLYEALTGRKMYFKGQALLDYELFRPIDPSQYTYLMESYEATLWNDFNEVAGKKYYFPLMKNRDISIAESFEGVSILEDIDGYFVFNETLNQRSKSYPSIVEIPTGVIDQIRSINVRESVYRASTDFLYVY